MSVVLQVQVATNCLFKLSVACFAIFTHLREQAASYYNPWGYGLILNMVEMPYQLVQVHTCGGLRAQQRAGHNGEQRAVESRAQWGAEGSREQGTAEIRAQ